MKKAYFCDTLENIEKGVPVFDNCVSVAVKPFEIITLKIIF